MTRILTFVVALFLLLVVQPVVVLASTEVYWQNNARGWFWYEDPPPPAEEEQKVSEAAPAAPVATLAPEDPLEQLKRVQEAIARAEAKAVLNPTEANVREYLLANQWQLNQASLFSDVWRRTVWQDPNLDYSLQRPTTSLAIHQFQDQRKEAKTQAVAQVANTHGLFFFFRGSCPYCHTFAPILKQFAEAYDIEVLPVSLDGGILPEYPTPRVDTQVAAELGVEVVPSVYLVDPRGRNVIPVGAGVMSADELAERIYVLTQTTPGKDY